LRMVWLYWSATNTLPVLSAATPEGVIEARGNCPRHRRRQQGPGPPARVGDHRPSGVIFFGSDDCFWSVYIKHSRKDRWATGRRVVESGPRLPVESKLPLSGRGLPGKRPSRRPARVIFSNRVGCRCVGRHKGWSNCQHATPLGEFNNSQVGLSRSQGSAPRPLRTTQFCTDGDNFCGWYGWEVCPPQLNLPCGVPPQTPAPDLANLAALFVASRLPV